MKTRLHFGRLGKEIPFLQREHWLAQLHWNKQTTSNVRTLQPTYSEAVVYISRHDVGRSEVLCKYRRRRRKKKTNFFSNSTHLFEQSLSQAVNSQSNTSEMPYFEWSNAAVHNDAVCFIIIQKQMWTGRNFKINLRGRTSLENNERSECLQTPRSSRNSSHRLRSTDRKTTCCVSSSAGQICRVVHT